MHRFDNLPIGVKVSLAATVVALCGLLATLTALGGARSAAEEYARLLALERRQVDAARRMQVVFKKQVQEWKNILLRGDETEDLEKYSRQFLEREAEVQSLATELVDEVADPEIVAAVQRFAGAHRTLAVQYREGLELFLSDTDAPRVADALVRGIDRGPTDMVDEIVDLVQGAVTRRAETLERRLARRQMGLGMAVITVLLASVGLALWVAGRIARPLSRAARDLDAAAAGDLTVRVGGHGDDEVGHIAAAVDHLLDLMETAVTEITDHARSLAAAAGQLARSSAAIGSSAEQTSTQARVVSLATERISANLSSVAEACEKMHASIRAIAESSTEAGMVAATATRQAGGAETAVTRLESSGSEVGEVVRLIDGIARQTDLLALNATIEAARAGAAGRGFGVVATEVKGLAAQTSQAIDGIRMRVAAIQADADATAASLRDIADTVRREHEVAAAITSAVEEQSASTSSITQGASDAAGSVRSIADSIAEVAASAESTSADISDIASASRHLADTAELLHGLTRRFVTAECDAGATTGAAAEAAARHREAGGRPRRAAG